MINPVSTRLSSAFKIEVYNSGNTLLEYLSSGPSVMMSQPSAMAMGVTPASSVNSQSTTYSISMAVSYTIASTVALIIGVPT